MVFTTELNLMRVLLLLSHFSCVQLCATPETAAHQAPLSLGVSRQEYWSGLPVPFPKHACMLSRVSHIQLCVTRLLCLEWVAISFSIMRVTKHER